MNSDMYVATNLVVAFFISVVAVARVGVCVRVCVGMRRYRHSSRRLCDKNTSVTKLVMINGIEKWTETRVR